MGEPFTEADERAVCSQLGRSPRGVLAVAHRCRCGRPDVVETAPRLPDGTPFPTMFYLTCPRAAAECGRLESTGLMSEMTERLATDPDLAARYRAAHMDYLARRASIEDVEEIRGVSAGGMPDRVKCLHVHLGHALAAGRGVNPIGDEVIDLIGPWWEAGPCVDAGDHDGDGDGDDITVRRARTADVAGIQRLIEIYADDRRVLAKPVVTLYEDVQEFWVAERTADGAIVGCGAVHVLWEDLAEFRTVAVSPECRGQRIGHRIVRELLATARRLGVRRVFVLTFETRFFGSFGFAQIDGTPVTPTVYEELLRSYDAGVAEFLDLEKVKPNTLGNTRMLLHLR